jgi:hypothetical protein
MKVSGWEDAARPARSRVRYCPLAVFDESTRIAGEDIRAAGGLVVTN